MKYLTDRWYCAAITEEITQKPLRRIICERPLVFFRTESGKVAALEDRCAHRQAPLSMGRVVGEHIQCMYHGFVFDCSGKCVHVPHQDSTPDAARVQPYPVVARWGYIWIWLGAADAADPTAVPDMPWTQEDNRRTVYFHFRVRANFQLMADNLMDVSHTDFLHRQSIGSQTGMKEAVDESKVELSCRIENDRVHFIRRVTNTRLGPVSQKWTGSSKPVTRQNTLMWEAPNTVHSLLKFENEECHATINMEHIMTPETAATMHYFMNWTRDFGLDNVRYPTDDDVRQEQNAVILNDDIPMVQAQQENIDLFGYPRDIPARQDQFVVTVHRILSKLYRNAGVEVPPQLQRGSAQRQDIPEKSSRNAA